jgi:hypothetical protein
LILSSPNWETISEISPFSKAGGSGSFFFAGAVGFAGGDSGSEIAESAGLFFGS